jgi:hypothetical protein
MKAINLHNTLIEKMMKQKLKRQKDKIKTEKPKEVLVVLHIPGRDNIRLIGC